MLRIVVSVRRRGDGTGLDFELPTDLNAAELVEQLAQTLGPPPGGGPIELRAVSLGRALHPDETLADAGLWDGETLILARAADPFDHMRSLAVMDAPTQLAVLPIPHPPVLAIPGDPAPARSPLPFVALGIAVLALVGAAGWFVYSREPAPTNPTPVAPTAQIQSTPEKTLTPGALQIALAPAPTDVPAPTAPAISDSDAAWRQVTAQLDSVWGVDWPASIGLLQAFHSQYPTQANATEKLYAAMVEYGRALRDAGATSAAADEFEQALRLAPQRFEARDELTALTPIPTAVPVQAPIAAPVAPQPTPVPPPVRVPAPTATPPPPPPTVDTSPGCDVTDPDIACPLANGSRIENLIQAPAGRHYYWFGIPTSGMLLHIEVNGEACPCSLRIFSDQTPIAAGLAVLERTMPIPGAYVLEVAPDQNGTNDAAYLLEFALQPPPTPTAAPVVEAATETPAPTSTPLPVPVPPVVGRTASDAVDRVRAVGLEARTQTADRYSPGGVGSIAVQDPPAGSLLPPGASVTLLVASGNVVVPDVVGMFEQDAWNALHSAGLDVDTRHARRSNVDAGRTADVNPGGGSVLPAGSTVVLTISQGN